MERCEPQWLNGCEIEQPWSPELTHFFEMFSGITDQRPFRTELSVFSNELNIAGQIDALFSRDDGSYVIWDWKRCKLLRYDGRTPMHEPLDHLPDVNYFHYALQLVILFVEPRRYSYIASSCHPSRML